MLRYNRHALAQRDAGDDLDSALIQRVAAHDEQAVAALYDRHSGLLYSLILRIVRDVGEAEDVLQDVFVSLWTRVHTYDASLGSPIAWLVRIARNRAIDRLRSMATRARTIESAPLPSATLTPEDSAAASEQSRGVVNALAALPSDQRVLIEDAYFLGMTHSELATRHHLPLGTVKTRIRVGMQALREALAALINRR